MGTSCKGRRGATLHRFCQIKAQTLQRTHRRIMDTAELTTSGVPTKQSGRDKPRSGIVLNHEQAREIYKCKLELARPRSSVACLQGAESCFRGKSVPISQRFGVSPKTVRDIWTRRTWAYATYNLWALEDQYDSTCRLTLPVVRF